MWTSPMWDTRPSTTLHTTSRAVKYSYSAIHQQQLYFHLSVLMREESWQGSHSQQADSFSHWSLSTLMCGTISLGHHVHYLSQFISSYSSTRKHLVLNLKEWPGYLSRLKYYKCSRLDDLSMLLILDVWTYVWPWLHQSEKISQSHQLSICHGKHFLPVYALIFLYRKGPTL